MTDATETIRLVAAAGRRHAIVEAWVAVALLIMTGLLADQGQAWQAAAAGVTAGILLGVAAFTAVRAFTWNREANKREGKALEYLALPFLPFLILGALALLFLALVWSGIVNVVRGGE